MRHSRQRGEGRRRSRLARAGLLTLALAAAAGLGLLASACGGSSTEGVAQVDSTQTTTDASTSSPDSGPGEPAAYSACMRSHGVPNFPDPNSNGGIKLDSTRGLDRSSPQFESAEEACKSLLPDGGRPDPQTASQEQVALLRLARCMRSHGVPNFPDPQPDGETVQAMPDDVDTRSPQFMAAERACRELVPGLFGNGATGTT
jgi:hypothetical protein